MMVICSSSQKAHIPIILSLLLFSCLCNVQGQPLPCEAGFTFTNRAKNITYCKKLGTSDAEFGWTYNPNTRKLDVIFTARPSGEFGWVAWGINLGPHPVMVGTQSLISFKNPNGTLQIDTYNITRNTKLGSLLEPSEIDLKVENKTVFFEQENGFLAVIATLVLPAQNKNSSKSSRINHVWQVGSLVLNGSPYMHSIHLENLESGERIDLVSGKSESINHWQHTLRIVHGVLNAFGWGTLLPIGVIVARYFRSFPFQANRWFILHIVCQTLAFCIGTTGFAIGLALGKSSKDYTFGFHRFLGILLFSMAALQMFALCLKPKSKDKYRKYWDIYHHFLGYTLIGLIITNIFHGISILQLKSKWKWAYIAELVILGCVTLGLEITTWIKFLHLHKGKLSPSTEP